MSSDFFANDDWTSWGRVVRAHHVVAKPRFADEAANALAQAATEQRKVLAIGLGRSYGDSNLNPDGALIDATGLDRIIAFDEDQGVLRAEAGISLDAILRFCVPRGWFLPTTPGTKFVTLAGAIANDVHGKNHHDAGTFGSWVRRIGLIRSDRGALVLDASSEPELFGATIAGLGLTGLIVWAELQLVRVQSAFLDQEIVPFETIDQGLDIAADSQGRFEHTSAWVDCTAGGEKLGRGVFFRANWADEGGFALHPEKQKLTAPIDGTSLALNPLFLRAFNAAYRANQLLKSRESRVHYAPHLYPLDAIGAWNRLYGPRGFYQYQCVVPESGGREAIKDILRAIHRDKSGSMLVVVKTFGAKTSPGLLSFPMPGITLAMDFCNFGARTFAVFDRLDAIVRAGGGRLYPAKDGRIPASMFQASFPHWRRFADAIDPALSSNFWRRVSQ